MPTKKVPAKKKTVKKKKPLCTGGYLHNALERSQRQKAVERLVKGIRASKISFDAIAFTGLSGALVGVPVADRLKKPIIAIRKEKTSHTTALVEGCHNQERYIIVDDCISSGDTIKNIQSKMEKDLEFKHYQLQAVFLYNGGYGAVKKQKVSNNVRVLQRRKIDVPVYG
jgi:orotate phosphoribosyltransferase